MTNLSITSVCNRSCDYCFARNVFIEKNLAESHMSQTTFHKTLDFLRRSGIDQVRLLGGEPTVHPDFAVLAQMALEQGFRLLVFSNGFMPDAVIRQLEKTNTEQTSVLINVLVPDESSPKDLEKQFSVFRRLGPCVIPGLNIHSPALKLDFMLDLIREFHLSPSIRLGLAHPGMGAKNHFLHPRYYSLVGQTLLIFARQAAVDNVNLEFDCGFVPCMFPESGLKILGKSNSDIGLRCNPLPDILPDGKAVSCYPLAGLHEFSFPLDTTADDLRKHFEHKIKPYRSLGVFRKCSSCDIRKEGTCVGGCLAAAMTRLRSQSITFSNQEDQRIIKNSHPANFHSFSYTSEKPTEDDLSNNKDYGKNDPPQKKWIIPYVDQPLSFWETVWDRFAEHIKEVYFPLPRGIISSGRPFQPSECLNEFLHYSSFAYSALINPIVLPNPVEEILPILIESLRKLIGEHDLKGITLSNLILAAHIRETFPQLSITASTLMDIAYSNQIRLLDGIVDTLVPSSRIMRDLSALKTLRESFSGNLRLIVNEACLPGCPFRVQHFYEMGLNSNSRPQSLCDDLLSRYPWMRLTGAWVLPQHLHLYCGIYDELKIAGRVTLQNSEDYLRVLDGYVFQRSLTPDKIGGGPASVLNPLFIDERFFSTTLSCGQHCHNCSVCADYYESAIKTC